MRLNLAEEGAGMDGSIAFEKSVAVPNICCYRDGSRATRIVSETHHSDVPPPPVVLFGACFRVAAGTFSGCSGGSVSGNAGPDVGDAAHAGENGGVE